MGSTPGNLVQERRAEPRRRREVRRGRVPGRASQVPAERYIGNQGVQESARATIHDRAGIAAVSEAPAMALPSTPQAPAPDAAFPPLGEEGWEPLRRDDAVLFLLGSAEGGNRLFILPARGLVSHPVFPARPAAPGAPRVQRGPAFSLPAVGHAGVHLVRTGQGVGMLVDAGGDLRERPSVLQATSLAAVQQRLGLTNVQGALITHAHADHIAGLTTLVSCGNLTGNQIWVYPGWRNAAVGPLGRALQDPGSGRFASAGLAAGWTPRTLETRTAEGPRAGETVTRASLVVGEARLEVVTDTEQLRRFNQALQAGDWRQATRHADAATKLTRVASGQGGPELLVVGDLRGRDLERLRNVMGDDAFRDFVGRARIVSGLHHLGAVSTAADVRGLQHLLCNLSAGGRQFTVVAQTGPPYPVNQRLIRALQLSGARVLTLGEPDPARATDITVRASGAAVGRGAREFAVDPDARQAQQRIEAMERALRVLELLPEYRQRADLNKPEIPAGLRSEITRLQSLLGQRLELATQDLHRATPRGDTAEGIDRNTRELRARQGMERTLGEAEIARLARSRPEITELERQLRAARARGEAGENLRRLIAQLDPQSAREILIDELGRPLSRNQRRQAWRNVWARLERQAELESSGHGGGAPARGGRGVAWLGLFLEAWHVAEPFITQSLRASREQSREDFYRSFRDLLWWNEKGLAPVAFGAAGQEQVRDPGALAGGIERRLYEDLPPELRRPAALSEPAQSAAALRRLYIPPLEEWPPAHRDAFWVSFTLWTSAHVRGGAPAPRLPLLERQPALSRARRPARAGRLPVGRRRRLQHAWRHPQLRNLESGRLGRDPAAAAHSRPQRPVPDARASPRGLHEPPAVGRLRAAPGPPARGRPLAEIFRIRELDPSRAPVPLRGRTQYRGHPAGPGKRSGRGVRPRG